jgi:hypothetical protein
VPAAPASSDGGRADFLVLLEQALIQQLPTMVHASKA